MFISIHTQKKLNYKNKKKSREKFQVILMMYMFNIVYQFKLFKNNLHIGKNVHKIIEFYFLNRKWTFVHVQYTL